MYGVRPLFVSTYPPEECGLATFTKDSADAVDRAAGEKLSSVAAIQKTRAVTQQGERVEYIIDNGRPDAYEKVAEFANEGPYDVVSLQHEFGLYPDPWGRKVLEFVQRCKKPIVTTFHTLLRQPEPLPRYIVGELAARSHEVIVMTRTAENLLKEVYGLVGTSIHVIPHGVPEVPFIRNDDQRTRLGLLKNKVICTFGLINRGKGLEHMIRAMPKVVDSCPSALYLVVGITHPQVKRHEGEQYREELVRLANSLGVGANVRFVNQYLDLQSLVEHLQACDVFVTPYPGKDQISSGTMAYAMATVGAIVSTPYLYAEEVLADGRGMLVPFGDSEAMADATLAFLKNPSVLAESRRHAYQYAKPMFWPNVGRQYLDVFAKAARFRNRDIQFVKIEEAPTSRRAKREAVLVGERNVHS